MKEVLVRVVNLKINIFIDFPLFIIKKKKFHHFNHLNNRKRVKSLSFLLNLKRGTCTSELKRLSNVNAPLRFAPAAVTQDKGAGLVLVANHVTPVSLLPAVSFSVGPDQQQQPWGAQPSKSSGWSNTTGTKRSIRDRRLPVLRPALQNQASVLTRFVSW